jgi:hypothetical protein
MDGLQAAFYPPAKALPVHDPESFKFPHPDYHQFVIPELTGTFT